ncbi:MAG: hypothetical protein HQ596_08275 [Candidatus Saganbacteria bacterium]|nr:hypothetical protein [Candidatus Saganbacteria bacterium]
MAVTKIHKVCGVYRDTLALLSGLGQSVKRKVIASRPMRVRRPLSRRAARAQAQRKASLITHYDRFRVDSQVLRKAGKSRKKGMVVVYEEPGGAIKEITVRAEDMLHLWRCSPDQAREHLAMIVKARGGDGLAAGELRSRWKEDHEKYFRKTRDEIVPERMSDVFRATAFLGIARKDVGDKGYNLVRHFGANDLPTTEFTFLTGDFLSRDVTLDGLKAEIRVLEQRSGETFGGRESPLIIALRGALSTYAPGAVPTFLNVGVVQDTLPALTRIYGKEGVDRIYINLLRALYGETVGERDNLNSLGIAQLEAAILEHDARLLSDPFYQLAFFVTCIQDQVDKSRERLAFYRAMAGVDSLPLTMIPHKMLFGVVPGDSYSGVLWTRDPMRGDGMRLEIGREDIYFRDWEEIKDRYPTLHYFSHLFREAESKMKQGATVEFVVENGVLGIFQINPSFMSGPAAVVAVCDLISDGRATQEEIIVQMVRPHHLKQLGAPSLDVSSATSFAHGKVTLPFLEVFGRACFGVSSAQEIKADNGRAILITDGLSPLDVDVLSMVDGVVTPQRFPVHVAALSRMFGVPALVGIEAQISGSTLVNASGSIIADGDAIALSSINQTLFVGEVVETPSIFMRLLAQEGVIYSSPAQEQYYQRLLASFRQYQRIIQRVKVSNLSCPQALSNFLLMLSRGSLEKAKPELEVWFDKHLLTFVDQLLKTPIGGHRPMLLIFNLLDQGRVVTLLKELVHRRSKSGEGTFIIGQLVFEFLRRNEAETIRQRFWDGFEGAEKTVLEEELGLAEQYIQVAWIGKRRNAIQDTGRSGGKFKGEGPALSEEALERLEDYEGQLLPGLAQAWADFLVETHKPGKLIGVELKKLGLG